MKLRNANPAKPRALIGLPNPARRGTVNLIRISTHAPIGRRHGLLGSGFEPAPMMKTIQGTQRNIQPGGTP